MLWHLADVYRFMTVADRWWLLWSSWGRLVQPHTRLVWLSTHWTLDHSRCGRSSYTSSRHNACRHLQTTTTTDTCITTRTRSAGPRSPRNLWLPCVVLTLNWVNSNDWWRRTWLLSLIVRHVYTDIWHLTYLKSRYGLLSHMWGLSWLLWNIIP